MSADSIVVEGRPAAVLGAEQVAVVPEGVRLASQPAKVIAGGGGCRVVERHVRECDRCQVGADDRVHRVMDRLQAVVIVEPCRQRAAAAPIDQVAEVDLMGGGYLRGNRTAVAEFNLLAGSRGWACGVQCVMAFHHGGLDLTLQAMATRMYSIAFAAVSTRSARFVVELLEFFGSTYADVEGMPSPTVHDPCAVARVIDPSVMTVRP